MTLRDAGALVCPACRGPLEFEGTLGGDALASGALRCTRCGRGWPVRDGLPRPRIAVRPTSPSAAAPVQRHARPPRPRGHGTGSLGRAPSLPCARPRPPPRPATRRSSRPPPPPSPPRSPTTAPPPPTTPLSY